MGAPIAIASVNLFSGFTAYVYVQLKKQLRPGETVVHCTTSTQHDSDFARARLLGLLENEPRPGSLILICVRPGPAVVQAYQRAGVPIILIDEEAQGASTVAADNFACGRLAGEHLVQSGRRTIAIVSGMADRPGGYSALHRQRGFRHALADAHLTLPSENVIEVQDYSQQDGAASIGALLERKPRVDAVFCAAGDTAAIGMLAGAKERGVRIGEDLAILSCDDLPSAAISDPPLSSIRQPIEEIAREAHRLAVDEREAILAKPRQVLLPPTLVLRRSA